MQHPRIFSRIFLTLCSAVVFCCFLTLTGRAQAEEPVFSQQKSFGIHARSGIGNVLKKLQAGGPVNVAYLGGSITMAAGYRVQTTQWLSEAWPNAQINEIHAGVSGTGSRLGMFRLVRDVLDKKPDLLFIEFAVNDAGDTPQNIWRQMENIVRQTWTANSRTDIVFVYTVSRSFVQYVRKGELPRSASAMEQLAEFYQIPTISFMKRVVDMQTAGKLIFETSEEPKPGILNFSKDGVHPGTEGHALYLKDIQVAFDSMKNIPPVDHQSQLKKTFVSDPITDARMYSIDESMLKGNWRKLTPSDKYYGFTNRLDTIWTSDQPGATLTFRFKGSEAMLYDVVGPDAGEFDVIIDGVTQKQPFRRYDSYCINHYSFRITATTIVTGLAPDKVHTVVLALRGDKPNRKPLADPKVVSEKDLDEPKFQGNHVRIGKILIRGEMVK